MVAARQKRPPVWQQEQLQWSQEARKEVEFYFGGIGVFFLLPGVEFQLLQKRQKWQRNEVQLVAPACQNAGATKRDTTRVQPSLFLPLFSPFPPLWSPFPLSCGILALQLKRQDSTKAP